MGGYGNSFSLIFLRGVVLEQEKEDVLLTKMEGRPQARQDVNELRARIETGVEAALEIPESQIITAINRIWPVRFLSYSAAVAVAASWVLTHVVNRRVCDHAQDKHFKTDEKGNIIGEGGTWRAPEYVVPNLDGFQLKAYVTRTKETNIDV